MKDLWMEKWLQKAHNEFHFETHLWLSIANEQESLKSGFRQSRKKWCKLAPSVTEWNSSMVCHGLPSITNCLLNNKMECVLVYKDGKELVGFAENPLSQFIIHSEVQCEYLSFKSLFANPNFLTISLLSPK